MTKAPGSTTGVRRRAATAHPVQQPADIGRKLRRLGSRQQHAEVQRVQELRLRHPLFLVHDDAVMSAICPAGPRTTGSRPEPAMPNASAKVGEGVIGRESFMMPPSSPHARYQPRARSRQAARATVRLRPEGLEYREIGEHGPLQLARRRCLGFASLGKRGARRWPRRQMLFQYRGRINRSMSGGASSDSPDKSSSTRISLRKAASSSLP